MKLRNITVERPMPGSPRQRSMTGVGVRLIVALVIIATAAARLWGQSTKIRVVGSDGTPIPYAWVSVEGNQPVVTDEQGEVAMTNKRNKTFTVEVRRIGYTRWIGPIDFPDTAAVISISLGRISQQLGTVTVTGERRPVLHDDLA